MEKSFMLTFCRKLLVFFAITSQLIALENYEEGSLIMGKDPLFVSLGGSCHTAIALRGTDLRKCAFPFDWLITTHHENFIYILDDDFQFFTDETCFGRHLGVPCCNNLYYQIGFPHDFDLTEATPEKIQAQWNVFKSKYTRRIERFRQLRDYQGKVFFVRAMWSSQLEGANGEFNENTKRAQEIRDALERYFPHLDFTLIILSYPDLPIPPMENIKGVVEFRIGRSHKELAAAVKKLLSNASNRK